MMYIIRLEQSTCKQGKVVGKSPSEEVIVGKPARGWWEQGGGVGQCAPHQGWPVSKLLGELDSNLTDTRQQEGQRKWEGDQA